MVYRITVFIRKVLQDKVLTVEETFRYFYNTLQNYDHACVRCQMMFVPRSQSSKLKSFGSKQEKTGALNCVTGQANHCFRLGSSLAANHVHNSTGLRGELIDLCCQVRYLKHATHASFSGVSNHV